MTKKEQKMKNAKIRMALREGNLPYQFVDEEERNYRKLIYMMSREIGCKFKVTKEKDVWTISIA